MLVWLAACVTQARLAHQQMVDALVTVPPPQEDQAGRQIPAVAVDDRQRRADLLGGVSPSQSDVRGPVPWFAVRVRLPGQMRQCQREDRGVQVQQRRRGDDEAGQVCRGPPKTSGAPITAGSGNRREITQNVVDARVDDAVRPPG